MKKSVKHEFVAPWEKAFDRVLTPLEDFIHRQTTSGFLIVESIDSLFEVQNLH